MNTDLHSYALSDFNLVDQVKLNGKLGLIKISRAPDGVLVLMRELKYVDRETQILNRIGNPLDTLSFVMDIGFSIEKELSFGSGYYAGRQISTKQSSRPIAQSDYNDSLLEEYDQVIQSAFQSPSKRETSWSLKMANLLQVYNNARLLYPSYSSESYLNLMRILDAVFHEAGRVKGAIDFALLAAETSPSFNSQVYKRVRRIKSFKDRLVLARKLAAQAERDHRKNEGVSTRKKALAPADRFTFACMYSAYEYRNKHVHVGLPFPRTIVDILPSGKRSGIRYLSPVLALSTSKTIDFKPDSIVDHHEALSEELLVSKFQNDYFTLLPTWYFLKEMARVAMHLELTKKRPKQDLMSLGTS